MPGTTRYSATFDRPYEEEDEPAEPPVTRRSRSQSLQINSANGRPYTPLGSFYGSHARSSSTDSGPRGADATERIPTRTAGNPTVKASHNPFQFVKVGTCSLYKKAAEQMKAQVKKQPEVLKEEEEDWQSNLDSWKTRRRKMSEDVFRRQEELRQLEIEEESLVEKKKTKTFSEMVEERAHRGRTLSLCLFSNPLEFDDWNFNKNVNRDKDEDNSNDSQHMSEGSEDNNNIISDDDDNDHHVSSDSKCTRDVNVAKKTRRIGIVHLPGSPNGVHNGVSINTKNYNGDFKESEHEISHDSISQKDESCISGMYIDSGLDSLSSSHRAGDIPDSGSDFSQDSGSSLDCDSPRVTGMMTTGMELLEEYSSKEAVQPSNGVIFQKEKPDGIELCLKLCLTGSKSQQYGFTINGGKDKSSPVTIASVVDGSVSELVGLKTGDQILALNSEDVSCLNHSTIVTALKQSVDTRHLELLLWRPLSNEPKDKLSKNTPKVEVSMNEKCCAKSVTSEVPSLDVKLPSLEEMPNNETIKTPDLVKISSSGQKISDDSVNNKKIASVKHKEINRRKPAPPIPIKPKSNEEIKNLENTKTSSTDEANSAVLEEKSVESENEMYVDDFNDVILKDSKQSHITPEDSQKNTKNETELHSIDNCMQLTNIVDKGDGNAQEICNQRVPNLCSVPQDVSLHIIYQSHPATDTHKSQVEESQGCSSSVTASEEKDMSKMSAKVEQQAQEFVNIPAKISPTDNSTFAVGEVLPVDKVAEEMERMILQQLEQEEQLREKNKQILSASDDILSTADNLNQELVISDIDAPPRQLEPPKEKPPPPPPVSINSEKDCGLKRVNSTKRIKKEMQKRRSDFLGIDNSEEEAIITDDDLACSSSSVETILKSECEQDRQQLSESEPLQKYPVAVDEDEIARKEREIIEHLETEERKRLENEKNKDEKELFVQAENFTAVQIEEERIKRLQEERKRMEEERFLREEQRVRMEEERQLREREEFVRKQEQASKIPGSDCVPSSDPNLSIDSEIKHLSHDKLLNCLNISNQSAEITSVDELLISPKPTSLLVKNQNQSIINEKNDPTISAIKCNIAQGNEILISEKIAKSNVKQDDAKIMSELGKLPKSSSSVVKKQNQNNKEKRDISEVYATKDIKTEEKVFLTDINTESNKKQNDIEITSKQTMLSVTTVKKENQNRSNKMNASAVVTSNGNITKEVLLSVTNSKSDVKQDDISVTSEQAEIPTPSSSTIKKQNQSNNKKKDISVVYGSKGKRAEKVLLTDTDTQPNNKEDDIKIISEQTDVPKTSFTIMKTENRNNSSNEKDASAICTEKNNITKEKEILLSDLSSKSNEKEDDIKNTTKQAELVKSSKVKKQNQNYIKKDVCVVYASKSNRREENSLFTDASIQSNKKQDDIKVIPEQAEVPKSSCTTVETENQNNSNEKDTSVMHTCKNNTIQENEVLLTDTRSKFNMKQNGINVISEQSEVSKSYSSVEKQNQNKKKDVSVAYANKGNKTEKVFHMDKSTQPNKKQDDIKIISEQADVPKPSFVIIETESQNNNSNEKGASAICTGKSNINKEKEILHSATSSKSNEKLGNINSVKKQAEFAKSSSSAVKKQNQNTIKKDVCEAVYSSKSNKKEENVLLTDASTQLNKKQDDIKTISEQGDAPKPSFTIIKTESQNNSSIKKDASAISAGKSNITEENKILLSDTSTKSTEKQSDIKITSKQVELLRSSSSSSKIKKQNQNNNKKDICAVNVSKSNRIDEKALITDAKTQSNKKQGDMKVIISEQGELPKSSCAIVEKENQNSSNKKDAPVIYISKGNTTQVKEVNDTSSICNVKQSDVKVMSEQTGLLKSSSTVKKQNQNSNEKKDVSVVCANKGNRAENVLLTDKNTQSNEKQDDIKISEQAELPQLINSVVKQHETNSNGKHLSAVCNSKDNIIQRNEVLLSETNSQSNEKHAIRDEKVITDQAKLPNSSFLMHKEQNQNSDNKDVSAACSSKSNIMVGKEVLLTASSSKSKEKQSDVKAVSELEKSTSSTIKKQNESNNNKKDAHRVCVSQYNVTEEIFFPTDTHSKSKEKQSSIKAISELQKSTSSTIKKQNTDNNKNNVHPVGVNEGNVTEEIFFPTDTYSKSNETHVSSTLNANSEQVGLPKSSFSSDKNQNQNYSKEKDILADCAKICTSEENKALLTDTNIQTTDKQDNVKVISGQSELSRLSSSSVKKQNQNNDKKDVITICAISCNKVENEILLTGTSSKSNEKQDLSNQKLSSQTELPKYVKKKNKHSKIVKQNSIESNSNKTLNNSDVSGNKYLSYSKPIITVEKESTVFAPLKYEQSITLCVNKISELPISSSNVLSSLSKSEAVHNLQNNHDNSSKLIITDCETVAKTSPAKSDAPKNLEVFNEQCCNEGTTLFSTPKSTNPKVNQFTHLSQIQQKHSTSDYGLETNAMESVRKIGVNADVITKQSNGSKTVENSKPHTGEKEVTPQKIKQLPFSETTPEPKLLKSTEQISENFIEKSAGLPPSLQSTQNIPLGQSSKPLIDMKPSLECASNKSQSNSLGSAMPLNSGSEACIQNNVMNVKIMPNEATESATNSENTGGPKLVRVRKRIKKKENKPSELISSNSASSSPGTATNIPESAKISNLQHSNCMVNCETKSAKSIKTDVINQLEDNIGNIPQVANCQKDEKLLESSSSVLSSSIATLNINTDKSLPVSSLSSSTSDNTSLSPSSDEKNKINKTSLIKPASNDDKIGGGNEEFGITVPQKPLKKKEVIRKERERLRQEQEALQREREEHRRQIQEQEQFKKNAQKPHAPDVPISRTGPPPPIKPALPTPLTSIPHVPQGIREDVAYTSRSLQGIAQNGQAGNPNIVGGTQALVNNTAEVWLPSQVQLSSRQIQSIPPQTQSPSKQCQGVPPQIQSSSRQGQSVPPQTQSPNRQGQSVPPQTQSPNRQGQGSKNRPSVNEQWTHQKVAAVRKQADSSAESRYNQNHWLIQEAEMRRITEQKERQRLQISSEPRFPAPAQVQYHQAHPVSDSASGSHKAVQRATVMPVVSPVSPKQSNYSMLTQMHPSEQQWNYGQPVHPNAQNRKYPAPPVPSTISEKNHLPTGYSRNSRIESTLQPPTKPSRVVPMERQEQMLSVSGRKRCSHCGEELGRGAAMIIESLQLFYHIQCFRCCVCQAQLGNGSCGTDVRVRNNKLHCHNCYSNDEAGLKFSQV